MKRNELNVFEELSNSNMDNKENEKQLTKNIRSVKHWYHQIQLTPTITTPGMQDSSSVLKILDSIGLPCSCQNLRVLDIGTRDGFFAFELESRKAKEVIGLDYVPKSETGFGVAKRWLHSKVQYVQDNVYNISPKKYGMFDIVLFLGVIYHLRNPLLALDSVRSVVKKNGLIFIESSSIDVNSLLEGSEKKRNLLENLFIKSILISQHKMRLLSFFNDLPLWQIYSKKGRFSDPSWLWETNLAGLRALTEQAGFEPLHGKIANGAVYLKAKALNQHNLMKYKNLDKSSNAKGFSWLSKET